MKLKNKYFIMIGAVIVGLYGVVYAMLRFMKGISSSLKDDLFFIMISIFLFTMLFILPRAVYIMLGGEPRAPENEINEINEKETSDSGSTSQY